MLRKKEFVEEIGFVRHSTDSSFAKKNPIYCFHGSKQIEKEQFERREDNSCDLFNDVYSFIAS